MAFPEYHAIEAQYVYDTSVLSSPPYSLETGWKFSMATSMCIFSLRSSGLTEPGPLRSFMQMEMLIRINQILFSRRVPFAYERDASGGI